VTATGLSIQTNSMSWEYAKAKKPKSNAFRVALLFFILGLICMSLGSYGISWDYLRAIMLLAIGFLSFILGILMLILHNNQMKISWSIDFKENSLVLTHELVQKERLIEIPYAKIEKVQVRLFSKKRQVQDKEHLTEVSPWGRGNYYSAVIETPEKVINLMELARKEDQEWLVEYLKEEIEKRKS
jgi:hypothetical protein